MRTMRLSLLAVLLMVGLATTPGALGVTDSMQAGTAELRSAGAIAFGPEAVLFIGDGMGGAIYAIDTADRTPVAGAIEVEDLSARVAALLGTTVDQILINDMAINPLSRRVYLSVSRGRGPAALPVIVRTAAGGTVEVMSLDRVRHAKAILPNAPNPDAIEIHGPGKGYPVRMEAIMHIEYVKDHIIVAGLSNEEFASNLRTIPFPFTSVPRGTAIEIYHGQHGQYETHAPVRAFTTYRLGSEDVILASYACTPLVVFRYSALGKGNKVMGKTIAELGSANTPIDMLVYRKAGRSYILLSNTDRGLMRIPADNLDRYDAITTPIPDTAGVPFTTVDLSGVTQVARLDDNTALILMAGANGRQSLKALPLP